MMNIFGTLMYSSNKTRRRGDNTIFHLQHNGIEAKAFHPENTHTHTQESILHDWRLCVCVLLYDID